MVDKSKAGDWSNVRAYTAVLSELDGQSEEVQKRMEELAGKVGLIVASSVLNFDPYSRSRWHREGILSQLLKPNGGILCHSDWPKSEMTEKGFTHDSAMQLYASGGLVAKSMNVIDLRMGDESHPVFFGVAVKE